MEPVAVINPVVTPQGHGLGLNPSHPHALNTPRYSPAIATLPRKTSNRAKMPPVRNQGGQGSCTGFAGTTAAWMVYINEGYHNPFPPSPAFLYYTERLLQGSTNQDSGASLTECVQALNQYGMCAEHWMPYNDQDYTTAPDMEARTNAAKHKATGFHAVDQTVAAIKGCLAEKRPVVLGIAVYQSFESQQTATTGMVPMPQASEQLMGWHAQAICDYDDDEMAADGLPGTFISQNSWGLSFGDHGYLHFPQRYFTNQQICNDLWTIVNQH